MDSFPGPMDHKSEQEHPGSVIQGWLVAIGLALALFIYGMLAYLVIGDKGPPEWDFGTVSDIPARSVYSTKPGIPGSQAVPQPQHVNEKPPLAQADASKERK